MTLFGVDVSEHNNGIELTLAKAQGIEFAIIRLCDGTYRDSVFASHLADAERAGMLVSTYWFLRAPSEGTTISQQVDAIDAQMAGRRDLGVWIDVEAVTRSGAHTLTGSDVQEAVAELQSRGYHVPGIYSGAWYWEYMAGGEPSMNNLGYLWESNYGTNRDGDPFSLYESRGGDTMPAWEYPLGNRKPDILQFGSNATVASYYPVDINAFKGTRADLEHIFYGGNNAPAHKEDEVSNSIEQRLANIERQNAEILRQLGQPGGWPQGGSRTLYDLAAASAEKLQVPDCHDTLA